MKRAFGMLMSVLMLMGMIEGVSVGSFKQDESAGKCENAVVETRIEDYKSEHLKVNMKTPVVSGLSNKEFEQKINGRIESIVEGYKKDMESKIPEYKKTAEKFPELADFQFELYSNFAVKRNDGNVLSIVMDVYYYSGGAHGMTERIALNYDLCNCKELKLGDLFKENYNYKKKIDDEIVKDMAKEKEMYFEGAFKGIKENTNFYLSNNGVVIYYPLYELAPYVHGIPEFTIPYDVLSGGMKKPYEIIKNKK